MLPTELPAVLSAVVSSEREGGEGHGAVLLERK
jgi:hypothetical protein